MRNFTIWNNPFIFDSGNNFVMVVNDCSVATAQEQKEGIKSYSEAECISKEDAKQYVDDMRVSYKIMGQNFNPSEYS